MGEVLGRALSTLRERWRLAALVTAVTLLAGGAVTAAQPRRYSASTKILIQPLAPLVTDLASDAYERADSRALAELDRYYFTQQDLIVSEAVARRVVTRLGLASVPGFAPTEAGGETAAVDALRARTQLSPSFGSQIFTITITDPLPRRAADLANALAEEYQAYTVEQRARRTEQTQAWLDEQLAAQQLLEQASTDAVQAFVKEHGLPPLSLSTLRELSAERVSELNRALAAAEVERLRAESRWQSLQSWLSDGRAPGDHPTIREDPVVSALRLSHLDERRRGQLDEAIASAVQSVEADHQRAALLEQKIGEAIAAVSGRAIKPDPRVVELDRLLRESAASGTLHEQLLLRSRAVSLRSAPAAANVEIIDRARVPRRPSSPRVTLSLLSTLALALLLGSLTPLLRGGLLSTRDVSRP